MYLVTIIGLVIASSPGYSLHGRERGPDDKQIPTAPSEWIESLWNSVYGLPVTKGVDEAMRPSLGFVASAHQTYKRRQVD